VNEVDRRIAELKRWFSPTPLVNEILDAVPPEVCEEILTVMRRHFVDRVCFPGLPELRPYLSPEAHARLVEACRRAVPAPARPP
jgi:hypothetical protein